VSRIFLSHSSANNADAVALREWLKGEGWDDVFLDVDPDRGIAAGDRWERALNEAAHRCEAVLFVVSRAWLGSDWCIKEFNLAHRLNKRLFGLLVEDLAIADLPAYLTAWQFVRLCSGRDRVMMRATMPATGEEAHVTFSAEGLARLKSGLQRAGLDTRFFAWPPGSDPNRPPYRGLRPLEAEDAGIFFGRDAPIVEALDRLRGLRDAAPPRLLVILGASGAGKSSFLRAGILPRLQRDDGNFLVLPVLRPERAAINGEAGLVRSIEAAIKAQGLAETRADIMDAICGGAQALLALLAKLTDRTLYLRSFGEPDAKPPTVVLPIDQGEELFLVEGAMEAELLLALLRDLLTATTQSFIVVFTIRSDSYDRLQSTKELDGIGQQTLSLLPLPRGAYQEVIEGPAERLKDKHRALKIEPALTQALLSEIEADGGRDALPLLAFTLERLYLEYSGRGNLRLVDYEALGRIKGSIEAAVERALAAADADPRIPRDRTARLTLLRRGFIPWLAGIESETGSPRRRIARRSEIPHEARPLIDQLVAQHLLATDVAHDTGEVTIEPAHEALLRQWGLLQGWLAEDAGLLAVLESVKRASRDWAASAESAAWLTHATGRLEAAERLTERPDLAANLEPRDRDYIATCRKAEAAARTRTRRVQAVIYALLVGIIAGLVGWIFQDYIKEQVIWVTTGRPYMLAQVRPYVLKAEAERTLKPLASFRECAKDCPEMIVVPAGEFMMGSPATEKGRNRNEGPRHRVTIAKPFAVSKFEVTFEQWDACFAVGGCLRASDSGYGRGTNPVNNVNWEAAQQYVAWFSKMTGRPYRLLSEAEWEYAARAGTNTAYSWGDEIGSGNANCDGCGGERDGRQPVPVGSYPANKFGLYDMLGNVWEWVEDCWHDDYGDEPPGDGSAWTTGCSDSASRVVRGGSWNVKPQSLRSAVRIRGSAAGRNYGDGGFRIGRTLAR
jgi:formylglycine-generating enzyme required for sulfatase activity